MTSRASHRARLASPKLSERQVLSRVKELEESNKAMERTQKAADRRKTQDVKEAKKKLTRELQVAQRSLTRNEHEASKLAGQLTRAEQEVQQAVARQSRETERREQGIGRVRQKHGKLGSALRDKMTTVGQARGRCAHTQMALAMLEKGVEIETECFSTVQVSGHGNRQTTQTQTLASQTEQDLHDGDTQLRDDLIVKLREETDQLRRENQELQEKLDTTDRRCTAAVQLLAEAQAAPMQKSNAESEALLQGSVEAMLKDGLEGAASLIEIRPDRLKGKHCRAFRGSCSYEVLSSSGEMQEDMADIQAAMHQTQPELVFTEERKCTGRPDQAVFTQPALPVANIAATPSVTQSPRVFPTLLSGVASATRITCRPQTPLAVPARMVSSPVASGVWPKYKYQQLGKHQAFIQPVAACGAAQVKFAEGGVAEPVAVKPTAVLPRA